MDGMHEGGVVRLNETEARNLIGAILHPPRPSEEAFRLMERSRKLFGDPPPPPAAPVPEDVQALVDASGLTAVDAALVVAGLAAQGWHLSRCPGCGK